MKKLQVRSSHLCPSSAPVAVHRADGDGGGEKELRGEVLQMVKKDTAIRLKSIHS
jgi:hypothetical protein